MEDVKKNERGFTLIEIMVVVVIMGLLATLVTVNLLDNADKAKTVKARADIKAIENALELYRLDNGSYPSTQEGLSALIDGGGEGGQIYLKGNVPEDPWGKAYLYLSPGSHGEFDIMSYGGDGEPGGQGKDEDITSWAKSETKQN